MRYSGIQPQYFPRLHYFARILNSDIFVIRDDAQFVAKHKYPDGKIGPSYQVHTPIKDPAGAYFLTVQIKHQGVSAPIADTRISYEHAWVLKHLRTIETYYRRSKNFTTLYPEIEWLLKTEYKTVGEINITTFLWGLLHILGEDVSEKTLTLKYMMSILSTQHAIRLKDIRLGSGIKAFADNTVDKNQRIVNACKEVGADEDYCGETAVDAYMDNELFQKNGINIVVQKWTCDEYLQLFTKQQGFISNLSIIDLLMNVDTKTAIQVLKGDGQ